MVWVGSLRGLGKLLVQHLADFLLHRALQRGQQETELRGHVKLLGGYGDPAVDAAAVELHLVAVPAVLDAELVGSFPCKAFTSLALLGVGVVKLRKDGDAGPERTGVVTGMRLVVS